MPENVLLANSNLLMVLAMKRATINQSWLQVLGKEDKGSSYF